MDLIEKQRRMTVLKKIDAWEKLRCSTCNANDHGNIHDATKCTCKASVEIRKLGVEYESGSKLRRQERTDKLLKSFTHHPLSVDVYDELKEMGVEDKFLIRHVKITNAEFYEWKRSVGRAKQPVNETPEQQQKREEYTKWLNVAIQNGVKAGTFRQRVIDYEIPYEEAVHPGRVRREHSKTREKVGAK